MRVLVVEDHPKMLAAISKGLGEHGFAVDVCSSGREGEELAIRESYDVIVLDVMLPDHSGIDICRNLRRRGCCTPVLLLTALSGTDDKVLGLDAGADDYLTKPFDFEELVARLRALLRRATPVEAAILRFEDICMNLAKQQVTRGDKLIDLTRKEFSLLEYFMRNPERVLTRSAIGEHVWDINFDPFSNVIDVYVSMLRKKLDKPFGRPLIHTVIGSGYRLGAPADVAATVSNPQAS
jgi:two-component system copper resistance phosphate regulon response regulator CusR